MIPDRNLLICKYRRFTTSLSRHYLQIIEKLGANYHTYQSIRLILTQPSVPDSTRKILEYLVDLHLWKEHKLRILYERVNYRWECYSTALGALQIPQQLYYHKHYFSD